MSEQSIRWICPALVLGVANHASASLPNGWSSLDIGTTGGSADEADGTWTVRGGPGVGRVLLRRHGPSRCA
ncbi:MAG: hypothetical protein ACYTAS_14615 [Planctomycetota bacterium]